MRPPKARHAGVAVMIAAAVLLAGYYAGPDLRGDAPGVCDQGPLGHHHWLWIRDGQMYHTVIGYDPDQDVSFIAPGCGHGHAGTALRVQGDHRELEPGFRLLLRPDGAIPGTTSPVPDHVTTQQDPFGPQPPGAELSLTAWDGDFRVASTLVLAWPLGSLLLLGGGLGPLLFFRRTALIQAAPAIGTAVGITAALVVFPNWILLLLWGSGAGLLAFLSGSIVVAARPWHWHPDNQALAAAIVAGLAGFALAAAILYPTYPYLPMM
jgi:hypothetical protein